MLKACEPAEFSSIFLRELSREEQLLRFVHNHFGRRLIHFELGIGFLDLRIVLFQLGCEGLDLLLLLQRPLLASSELSDRGWLGWLRREWLGAGYQKIYRDSPRQEQRLCLTFHRDRQARHGQPRPILSTFAPQMFPI